MMVQYTCTVKPVENDRSKNNKIGFQYRLSLNAGQTYCRMLHLEHSAILSTFIKLPSDFKSYVLSILSGLLRLYIEEIFENVYSEKNKQTTKHVEKSQHSMR